MIRPFPLALGAGFATAWLAGIRDATGSRSAVPTLTSGAPGDN